MKIVAFSKSLFSTEYYINCIKLLTNELKALLKLDIKEDMTEKRTFFIGPKRIIGFTELSQICIIQSFVNKCIEGRLSYSIIK